MLEVIQFFIDNSLAISILSICILLLLGIFAIYGNKFDDIASGSGKKDIGKVVTIEAFPNEL